MTTIAYRDGVMAADGRMTADNSIMNEETIKVHKMKDGTLIGFAGAVAEIIDLTDKLLASSKFDPKAKHSYEEVTAIAVTKDGTLYEYADGYPRFLAMGKKEFYSIGSGESWASGAMAAGADAETAIAAAIRFDTMSGGKIHTVRLDS